MAAVPFGAQALVSTISPLIIETASTQLITLKALIEDFLRQLSEAKDMIVNVIQSSANISVMHCSSSRHAEILLNTGFTFRSYPVSFAPAPAPVGEADSRRLWHYRKYNQVLPGGVWNRSKDSSRTRSWDWHLRLLAQDGVAQTYPFPHHYCPLSR